MHHGFYSVNSSRIRFGADYAGGGRLDGRMDEVRIHNTARSDNYITTRYNNMGSPSTFWTIGQSGAYSATSTTVTTETYAYNVGRNRDAHDSGIGFWNSLE